MISNFWIQAKLLIRDLEFYCPNSPPRTNRRSYAKWLIRRFSQGICCSRDFRLNLLVRLSHGCVPILSRLADFLIFAIYHSFIPRGSILTARIRFCHSTNVVIGSRVELSGDFAYVFSNVTIGKLLPGTAPSNGDMPILKGSAVFGTGSVVLGSMRASSNVVFAANSLCTLKSLDRDSTVYGVNTLKDGVYFNRLGDDCPFVFYPAF